jgi:PAS domain S-box-containing protein
VKSENYYQELTKYQKELICVYDRKFKIKWINEAYAKFFCREKEDLIGRSLLELVPQTEHKSIKKMCHSLSEKNPEKNHTNRVIIAPNSEIVWQEWKNIAIYDDLVILWSVSQSVLM